jgi:hypothetical protein
MRQITEQQAGVNGVRCFFVVDPLSRTRLTLSIAAVPSNNLYNGQVADVLTLLNGFLHGMVLASVRFEEVPVEPEARSFTLTDHDQPVGASISILYLRDESRDGDASHWVSAKPCLQEIKLSLVLLTAQLAVSRHERALPPAN